MTLKPGTRLGPYEILSLIGAGGMGEVYRARDTRLERIAAVKVLPEKLASDQEFVKRFKQEARLASSLNHPNIITIYEIERSGSVLYIAMEFVDGETLADLLATGPMPIRKACEVAAQIASGLAKAHTHETRIVHRDLKPQNVMIRRDSLVKILDFGLGKVTPPMGEWDPEATTWGPSEARTLPGTVVGTPGYMSPQQASGRPVDFRSDQFSLGTILYQMVTGKHPFLRGTAAQTLSAIIEHEPEAAASLNPAVPAALQTIIERCLAKDPEQRYAWTEELARELKELQHVVPEQERTFLPPFVRTQMRRWPVWLGLLLVITLAGAGIRLIAPSLSVRFPVSLQFPALPAEKQLVVLPFTNVGDDPANQAFCDGLVEILSSKLSQLEQFQRALRVVPASEVRREGIQSAREARQVFGVTLVITGSVQRTENRVRLTINLVDSQTLRQLKSRPLDTEVRDISVLQDSVVLAVAELLELDLSLEARQVLTAGGTTVPGAYEFYTQGQGYLLRYEDAGNIENAIGLFQRTVQQDSQYALAHAGLCEAYWRRYELTKDSQWVEQARKSCAMALELNDKLAPVYVTLGLVDRGAGRYEEAIQTLQKALDLNPINPDAYKELANVYEALGRQEEAEATYKKAIAVRPNYWASYNDLGRLYSRLARYDEAAAQYRRVIELTPDNSRGYSSLGLMYVFLKRYDDAKQMLERSVAIKPNYPAYTNLGRLYFSQQRYSEAAQFYERALRLNEGDYQAWRNLAATYQWMPNEREKARAAYTRAAQLGEEERRLNPRQPSLLMSLADCYAMLGQPNRARDLLRQALTLAPNDVPIMYSAANIYEQLGDRERALEWLGTALRKGLSPDLVEKSPNLAQLRADPRFQGLLRP